MAAVVDENGTYLGEGMTERDNAKQFILNVMSQDHALRFEIMHHFNSIDNQPIDAEVI